MGRRADNTSLFFPPCGNSQPAHPPHPAAKDSHEDTNRRILGYHGRHPHQHLRVLTLLGPAGDPAPAQGPQPRRAHPAGPPHSPAPPPTPPPCPPPNPRPRPPACSSRPRRRPARPTPLSHSYSCPPSPPRRW